MPLCAPIALDQRAVAQDKLWSDNSPTRVVAYRVQVEEQGGRARGWSARPWSDGRCRHGAGAQPDAARAMSRPVERAPASDGAVGAISGFRF